MPLIEELLVTHTSRVSHGWAYVPDTGAPIAAVKPGTRKRGNPRQDGPGTASRNDTAATAKQVKALQARLEKLDEDNYKKVDVPLPHRVRDKNRKTTTNVRRILGSDRQFKHYHDAQVAELLLSGGGSVTNTAQPALLDRPDSKTLNTKRKDSRQHLPMQPPPRPQASNNIKTEPTTQSSSSTPITTPSVTPPLDHLLQTPNIPLLPSARVIAALLAEPPLTYDAATAKPQDPEKRMPTRHFCGVCGYWGKVRCRWCGERTCGLMECWKGHEGVCPVPH